MRCRVCGHRNAPELLRVPNQPRGAHSFPTEKLKDTPISLMVCVCPGCGLVQLANDAVPYWVKQSRARIPNDAVFSWPRGTRVLNIESWPIKHPHSPSEGAGRQKVEYDAITILNYLEHVPEPRMLLHEAWRWLAEDGQLIVQVPNFDMVTDEVLVTEFLIDHLCYFTAETLTRTLEINGFRVDDVTEVERGFTLQATASKRMLPDLKQFNRRLSIALDDYVVWGAGHHALAALSLYDMDPNYVVDSSPDKQFKLTPVTHIPIYPPSRLDTHPPRAVVVIAAGYSEEIAVEIKDKFETYILRPGGLERWS